MVALTLALQLFSAHLRNVFRGEGDVRALSGAIVGYALGWLPHYGHALHAWSVLAGRVAVVTTRPRTSQRMPTTLARLFRRQALRLKIMDDAEVVRESNDDASDDAARWETDDMQI